MSWRVLPLGEWFGRNSTRTAPTVVKQPRYSSLGYRNIMCMAKRVQLVYIRGSAETPRRTVESPLLSVPIFTLFCKNSVCRTKRPQEKARHRFGIDHPTAYIRWNMMNEVGLFPVLLTVCRIAAAAIFCHSFTISLFLSCSLLPSLFFSPKLLPPLAS